MIGWVLSTYTETRSRVFIQVGFHRLQCTRYDTDQNDQQTKGHYVGVCILTWLGGTLIYLLLYTI